MTKTTKKYENDAKEICSILSELYEEEYPNQEYAFNALNYLCAEHKDAYLKERMQYFKEYEFDEKENKLTWLYKKFCQKEKCAECPVAKYCNYNIQNRNNKVENDAPTLIDLFCGAGGLSLGFVQAGFKVAFANDIEECCVDTYSHNHPEIPRKNIVCDDINNIMDKINELKRFDKIDIVVGGPPCQGFSMANRQRVIDDPRNKLYKSYVKVVDLVKPKFFVMENVKGMYSVANQIIEDFEKIGYTVSCKILNAKDYGVPQNRERLIFIGNNVGYDNEEIFKQIEKTALTIPKFVLKDALYGLRELKALQEKNATERDTIDSGKKIEKNNRQNQNEYISIINQNKTCGLIFNHKARYNNERDIEIFRRLKQGDKSDDPKIADIMPYKNRNDIFKDKYFKLEENKVCKTITAHMKFDCNMYIHPTQARGLTPREAARVQSYPDDYFFRGSYTKTYMQIGNSVPPLLSKTIAQVIKRCLEEEQNIE